ncbi:MAG: pyruvate kinase [Pseudanabaenaceae cyanobacterium]
MLPQRTKIVATIGPASNKPEVMESLIRAGLSVARLNFSHGSYNDHAQIVATFRRLSQALDVPVALLQDLQGPKIRVGVLPDPIPLAIRETVELVPLQEWRQEPNTIPIDYPRLAKEAQPGNRVLLDDGLMELVVLGTQGTATVCEVVRGGMLRSRKSVNLPDIDLSLPSMTPKDLQDLEFGLSQGVDWVSLSFVRKAEDIAALKQRIRELGYDVPVIAKIEKPQAMAHLDEIIHIADGIMVARGDLGVELSPEKVPLAQKEIIKKCNRHAIPVITATQMLESMMENARPTRAEASDVANAILDGTDAIMLSGESAVGKYPVQAVEMMVKIAREIEAVYHPVNDPPETNDAPHAIREAIHTIEEILHPRAIVLCSITGESARLVAAERLRTPIYAVTTNRAVYYRMSLLWGITPLWVSEVGSVESFIKMVEKLLCDRGVACPGDQILVVGGTPVLASHSTNFIKIHTVGEEFIA